MVQAAHRLILTGTPIENSLDEFVEFVRLLDAGLLSTYDRFVEKYMRHVSNRKCKKLRYSTPQIFLHINLRRMKKDVLDDLPPVLRLFTIATYLKFNRNFIAPMLHLLEKNYLNW